MKRIISGILIAIFALALTACKAPVVAPEASDAPAATDEPAATDVPVVTDEPLVTEEPVTGIKDFFALVERDSAITLDLDFDGEEETVSFFTTEDNEYGEFSATVTVSRGNNELGSFTVDGTYLFRLIVLDCDETDSRLDIVASWAEESDDWSAKGLRITEEENVNGLDAFDGSFGFNLPADYDFHSEKGFRVFTREDALGTYDLETYCTLTSDGFKSADGLYLFPIYETGYEPNLELVRELEVKLLSGEPYDFEETGETYTIPVGTTIYPLCTDLETYIILRFDGGRFGKAELAPKTGEYEWGYLINGIDQDEYGQIPYAD
jgi:hypothetical protein